MQMFAGLDASAAPHRSDRSEFDAQAWIAFLVLLLNLLRMNNLAERIGYGDGDKVDFGRTLAFRRSTARRSNFRASIRRRRAAAAR